MSTNGLTPHQQDFVDRVALNQGLKDYKVHVNSGSLKGDNYLGIIHSIAIEDSESSNSLYLILKSAHSSELVRKSNPIPEAFKREDFLYTTIIPRLQQIQKEYSISSPFTGVAKHYGSCLDLNNESILMENLKESGYKLWNRKNPMDDAHMLVVFKEYSRFHAASLAWRHHYPEEFFELTKDIQRNVIEENSTGSKEKRRDTLMGYFQAGIAAAKGNAKALSGIQKLRSQIVQLIERSNLLGRDRFVVLHGDCWCNNMLFKYHQEDQATPTAVRFIDWQLSKMGSPILDLAYFFSVCASKELFSNLKKYLAAYHHTMSKSLREFGCKPDDIYSFSQLLEDWNRNAWYGVFLAMIIIKMMLSEAEEAPELSQGQNEGKDIISALTNFSTNNESEYERRLCDLVEFMVDNDYI